MKIRYTTDDGETITLTPPEVDAEPSDEDRLLVEMEDANGLRFFMSMSLRDLDWFGRLLHEIRREMLDS